MLVFSSFFPEQNPTVKLNWIALYLTFYSLFRSNLWCATSVERTFTSKANWSATRKMCTPSRSPKNRNSMINNIRLCSKHHFSSPHILWSMLEFICCFPHQKSKKSLPNIKGPVFPPVCRVTLWISRWRSKSGSRGRHEFVNLEGGFSWSQPQIWMPNFFPSLPPERLSFWAMTDSTLKCPNKCNGMRLSVGGYNNTFEIKEFKILLALSKRTSNYVQWRSVDIQMDQSVKTFEVESFQLW